MTDDKVSDSSVGRRRRWKVRYLAKATRFFIVFINLSKDNAHETTNIQSCKSVYSAVELHSFCAILCRRNVGARALLAISGDCASG
jgi:hypothetical protein